MVSRGAEMIEYWHWHTLPFGIENHWGGILPHSLIPGRSYRAFQETAKSISAVSKLGRLKPAAEVAIVINTASKWLFEYQGPIRGANGLADPLAYQKTLQSMYEIAFNNGLGVRLIGDNQITEEPAAFAKRHPIMILHSLYAVSAATLEFAREYAAAGGTLIVGPRTGYAKSDAVIRTETAPAILGEAASVSYSEYSMLAKAQSVSTSDGVRVGAGWAWFDELEAEDSETVLKIDHPFFGKFAALTTKQHGGGTISFLASYPDQELAGWLGRHFGAGLAPISAPSSSNPSVVVNRAFTQDGKQVSFVFNWGWDVATIELPMAYSDVESDKIFAGGETLELEPWGVRVLIETA
jgi:beta-galactosidase